MNEVTRWDQGGLSSGVAISTDTRSQSKRKMTAEEFQRYISAKIEPMAMDFMREVEQAIQRADIAKMSQSNQQAENKMHIDAMRWYEELNKHHTPAITNFVKKQLPGLQKAILSEFPTGYYFIKPEELDEYTSFNYGTFGDAGHEGHIRIGDHFHYENLPNMKTWSPKRTGTPAEWRDWYIDQTKQIASTGTITYSNGWNDSQAPSNRQPQDYGKRAYFKISKLLRTPDGQDPRRAPNYRQIKALWYRAMNAPSVRAKLAYFNNGSKSIKIEAAKKAYRTLTSGPNGGPTLGAARNISMHVNTQRALSGIDKLRGHGRPVLSEQQGTKGLAGLFPALRSSMQGALRQ